MNESHLTEPGGALDRTRRIEGVIVNTGGDGYALVQVSFNLYDKDGKQLGTTSAQVDDLGSGRRWRFSAVIPASIEVAVTRYEVANLQGSR